jgi:WD40 repeat protein
MLPILLLLGIAAAGDGERLPEKPAVSLTDSLGDALPAGALARMGSARFRHSRASKLLFLPDGKTLITAGGKSVCFWERATGKLLRRVEFGARYVADIALTGPGIAVVGETSPSDRDKRATVWLCDPATGAVRTSLPGAGWRRNGSLSPDGRLIASLDGKTLFLHDSTAGQELFRVPVDDHWMVHSFSPDGKTFAVHYPRQTVRVHDATAGAVVRELKVPDQWVGGIVYSPDARYLAVASSGDRPSENVTIWDLKDGKQIQRLQSSNGVVADLAFAPDGRHLALASEFREIRLVDFHSGKEIRRFPAAGRYSSLKFSPDGKTLAAIADGGIRLWDRWTARVLPGSADPVTGLVTNLAFGGDGKELRGTACVPYDTSFVRIAWDSATGSELRRYGRIDNTTVFPVTSPDETLLAIGREDGRINLYDAKTGNNLRPLTGHGGRIWQVIFSPDSRRLISQGADASIRQWDVATGRELLHLPADKNSRPMKLSRDGRWLAVEDGPRSHIVVWDLLTRRENMRGEMPGGPRSQLALLVDEHFLIAATRLGDVGEIRRWDMKTGRHWPAVQVRQEEFRWGDISPDGRMVAIVGDGKLRVLEAASGGIRREFVGHEGYISSFAFSPDGRRLAAASPDGPVYIWEVVGNSGEKGATREEIAGCWADLADADAAVAFRAICKLAAAPNVSVRLLRDTLRPSAPPDPKAVARLIQGLDSDSFAERQKSADAVKKLGDTATDALRKARANASSAETLRQLDDLIDLATGDSPETLRSARAVEALEWMATPAAATLLDELARGLAGTRLTREASVARDRLRRKPAAPAP